MKDLLEGSTYTDQVFAVEEVQEHTTRTGNPYYRLALQDRTGEITARIWQDNFEQCKAITDLDRGDIIRVDGEVQSYNGSMQMVITKLAKTDQYDLADLIEVSEKDVDGMWTRILSIVDEVKDPHIKQLLKNIYEDPVLGPRIKNSPAGLSVHHDYVGGLIEHMLEIYEVCQVVFKQYPRAKADLVNAGILLHDLGKIEELRRDNTVFVFTRQGSFKGHLVISVELMLKYMPQDLPEDIKDQLIHIIVSHNSAKELGSPVVPATLEAIILAKADDLSAKVRTMDKVIATGKPNSEGFTPFNRFLNSSVLIPSDEVAKPVETEQE